MPPRRKPNVAQQLDQLVDPDSQEQSWLVKHVAKRHNLLRYITKGEHDADHRLHQPYLDHYHEGQ